MELIISCILVLAAATIALHAATEYLATA